MKISIVTISYNQVEYLKQCIESVLNQDSADVEYIVVDPGSTDGSRELIDSYGDRIIRIYEKDKGPADGLNKGFASATGDVFGFVNSDDYLLPHALKYVAEYFADSSNESIVSGNGFIEYPGNKLKHVRPTLMKPVPYVYGACTVFQQGTFFRALAYRRVGGFNPTNKTCWDGELFVDFLLAGYKHDVFSGKLAVFRMYPDSITGSGRLADAYKVDHARIFNKVMGRRWRGYDYLFALWWRARKIVLRSLTGR